MKTLGVLLLISAVWLFSGVGQAMGLEVFCGAAQSNLGGGGKSGFVAGIGQDWAIDNNGLAFGLEGEYIEKGGKGTVSYHIPGSGAVAEEEGNVSLKYFQLSLLLKKIKSTGTIRPQVYCGGGLGFLLSDEVNFSISRLISDEFQKVDAHLSAGIAAVVSDRILFDLRYTKGLRNLSDEEINPYSHAKSRISDGPITESKNSTWQAAVGICF